VEDDPAGVVEVLLVMLAGAILSRSLRQPGTAGEGFRELVITQLAARVGVSNSTGKRAQQGK
jgi:hypothetical protein